MSKSAYAKYNRLVMSTLFFPTLLVIAFWETNLDTDTNMFMKSWFSMTEEGEENDPKNRDPEVDDPSRMKISKVSFEELVSLLISFKWAIRLTS